MLLVKESAEEEEEEEKEEEEMEEGEKGVSAEVEEGLPLNQVEMKRPCETILCESQDLSWF